MNNKKNWGKEIKQVGILLIVIGIAMIALIIYGFAATDSRPITSQSALVQIINNYFVFLIIGGLVSLLAGIIVRSIGRTKELKFYAQNGMNPNFPNQPNPQYNPYQQPIAPSDQQNNNQNNQQ